MPRIHSHLTRLSQFGGVPEHWYHDSYAPGYLDMNQSGQWNTIVCGPYSPRYGMYEGWDFEGHHMTGLKPWTDAVKQAALARGDFHVPSELTFIPTLVLPVLSGIAHQNHD